MEKENFDEELKNRIKQVFEEYDDGAADEGWNLLREKYPVKNRRKYFFWWLSFVAALLLIAFVFWFLQLEPNKKQVVKAVKQHGADSIINFPESYSSAKKAALHPNPADMANIKKTPVKTASGSVVKGSIYKNNPAANRISIDLSNAKKIPVKTVSGFNPKQTASQEQQAALTSSKQEIQIKPETGDQKNTSFSSSKNTSVSTTKQANITALVLEDSSVKKQVTPISNLPKVKTPVPKKTEKAGMVKKPTKKLPLFSLGLYAGPHLTYSGGSSAQLGLGAGFSTDFQLGKNFKISTGLGLMQNNLTYNQNIPNGSLLAASNNSAASLPSSSVTIVQSPSLSRLDARLVTLDIPLNLTYIFLPGKNSISVSAGISSNTFIKETYDYSNSINNTQTIKSFNNFDFAKTLNIAAGFAYPFGKNKLQIEPFLKYPLSGMGSQQLKFGSVGVNLKMNL